MALITMMGCRVNDKIPPGVLSQEQMRRIMWDLIRTDIYVSDFLSQDSTINRDESRLKLYQQVYRLHKTDKETFKKSLAFYQSRPDLLKVITDSLRVDERKANEEQLAHKNPQPDTNLSVPQKLLRKRKQLKDSLLK
jgi:hypothetical protein